MKKFAFVFPGQGSQRIGMLSNIASQYSTVEETFHEASRILGYCLWTLVQNGPAEELNKTWKTQPALLTASVALWRIWQEHGGKPPLMMAGHSLGEYSALVCAGAIDFYEALHLVEIRGKFMQEALPENTGAMMVIIGLDDISIVNACEESAEDQVVSIVSFNSPGQVVIAGHKEAVIRAALICKEKGAKCTFLLPISVPSHCILMRSAAKKLETELKKVSFKMPVIPVINNVDVKCETTPEAICYALVRQLYSPIQWTQTVEFMLKNDIRHLYEIGPGKVLTTLTKRISNTLTASALNELDAVSAALSNKLL